MKKNKIISLEEALTYIQDGKRIMIGGFAGTGNPMKIINAMVEKGVKDLTLIANDTGNDDTDLGRVTINKLVKKVIASHIGTNRETVRQFTAGEIDVEFSPQGTLVERIRAAGFGLGGVLTPTGVGTEMEIGKEKIEIDGKQYLLEKPLRADVAIVKVKRADKMGNVEFYGTNVAHSEMMLTAADITIVQADEIVEIGDIAPEDVTMPGIFVDYIVDGGN